MDADHIDNLHSQLLSEIEKIETKETNVIHRCAKIAILSKSYITKLRDHILETGFDDLEQEIFFFKVSKPKFSSLVYFYEKIYTLETKMPDGTAHQKSVYLAQEIAKIDYFYKNNTEFSSYMKSESTIHDQSYFVVGNGQLSLGLGFEYHDFDPLFGSVYSSMIARFLGSKKALEYINNRMANIKGFDETYVTNPNLEYNGTNTELIELAYALQKSGKVKSDIKKIISVFESIFNVSIKDIYRTYHGFKSRKTDRTKFLSFLRDQLNQALDED